jgi:hypothetical protein
MKYAQAEIELAIHHLKQVEERISSQREKIARLRAGGLSPEIEKERLASLLRSLEGLKARLANGFDHGKPEDAVALMLIPARLPSKALRINITMDEGLIERIDAVSTNRSAFLADAARNELDRREGVMVR